MKNDITQLAHTAGQVFNKELLIFKSSNEDLREIFNKYNVKNKDVLTVLASSDQALSCYYNGAKSIETFDRSIMTLYYYYLRKWLILYKKELYPSYKFLSFVGNGDYELYKLVCNIVPTEAKEKEAKLFWKEFMAYNNYKANFLFEDRYCDEPRPFNNIDSIKNIYNNQLTFYNIDITKKVNLNKTYDVLYLSNILEYSETKESRNIIRLNIENLLKDNGIAICTYKLKKRKDGWHQEEIKELTNNKLILDSEYKHYKPLAGKCIDLAYAYKKI